jgi:hypothetical protein
MQRRTLMATFAAALCLGWLRAVRAQDGRRPFTREELDQMLAPIALYPDALLSQTLMAATYPLEVVEAARWSRANPGLKGDAAVAAVANQDWDVSVKSLTAFPQVLANMDAHLDWTQKLGDAMLGQQQDVADSVQRLRAEAAAAGNLASNSQQTVSTLGSGDDRMIEIEPVNAAMIYVPYYNPTWAYGNWPYAAYPPDYYPPQPIYGYGAPLASGIMFGIGLAASSAIFGGWNWRRGNSYVNVNVDRAVHIDRTFNAATVNNGQWQHNADHRKGVAYRDPAVSQQYGQSRPGVDQRQQYRGRTANAPASQPAQPAQATARPAGPPQPNARPAVPQQPGARPAVPQQTAPVPQRAATQPGIARATPVQPPAAQRPGVQPLPQVQTRAPTTTPTAQRGAALSGIDRGQQVNHEAARGRAQQTRAAAPAAAARPAAPARPPAAAAARPAAGTAHPAAAAGGQR